VFELRVFQLRDGDVRGCVVPADLAADLDMMADMSEPVARAYLERKFRASNDLPQQRSAQGNDRLKLFGPQPPQCDED
jgi:hypothetical protein